MADLKIRTFKRGCDTPDKTITVPERVLGLATRFMPKTVASLLADKGIDVAELVALAGQAEACGVVAEIEDHVKGERTVVSLE